MGLVAELPVPAEPWYRSGRMVHVAFQEVHWSWVRVCGRAADALVGELGEALAGC